MTTLLGWGIQVKNRVAGWAEAAGSLVFLNEGRSCLNGVVPCSEG